VVRELPKDAPIDSCQVLFLPESSPSRRAVLQRVSRLPILTVGDSSTFLDEGGIVQLRLIDSRIRFDISVPAADRVGLRLSSQLLRLAVTVRGGPS
jgi:hypothetical protein